VAEYRRSYDRRFGHIQFSAISDRRLDEKVTGVAGHPYAEVTASLPKEKPNFSQDEYGMWLNIPERDNKQELFRHQPGRINSLFADPSMKPHVGTLLGMVMNSAKSRGTMEASDDLSPFSSRLAKKGVAAGVVQAPEGNATVDVTNSIKAEPMTIPDPAYLGKVASPEEVSEGRATMRNLLGGRKQGHAQVPRVSGSQFEQQTLF
jgi:hypothetical protein